MKDIILDFIEDHRKAVFITIGIIVVIAIMFGIRSSNAKKKAELEEQQRIEAEQQAQADEQARLEAERLAAEEEAAKKVDNTPSYQSSLNKKIEIKRDESKVNKNKVEKEEEVAEVKPNFEVSCNVFTHTEVPDVMVDGSSCKAYLRSVNLIDFGTFWGSKLDINDMKTKTKHLVGVDQDDIDVEVADLESVGWLISNFDKLGKHDAIKFTNLHIIGSLSDDHVAVLCCYDWYSAFGLKDTLVLFEDISGTLKKKDFSNGAVFSALAFVHNMKVVKVNGQNVVCVQYNVF